MNTMHAYTGREELLENIEELTYKVEDLKAALADEKAKRWLVVLTEASGAEHLVGPFADDAAEAWVRASKPALNYIGATAVVKAISWTPEEADDCVAAEAEERMREAQV